MQTIYYDLRDTKGQQKEIEDKISAAAKILREGGLVGIPTETVYGLGADGTNPAAVRRIFEVKGRPQDNPLILHVTGAQWLPRYCADIPPVAYTLARKFWPGPLTMVLKRQPTVPDETTAGLDTVGVRCPNHPVTLAIIREAGMAIAAPSANTSGRPSCTSAQDVLEDVGVEATVLDLTQEPPRLLRPGGLPMEDIERLIGHIDVDRAVAASLRPDERPGAPGMKYRHYAPKAPVTVVTGSPTNSARKIAERAGPGSGVICFDEYAHLFTQQVVRTLGPCSDKQIQAQRVFEALRSFDSCEVEEIFAQCPDNRGLGLAIGNRLKKAAGFHVINADSQRIILGVTGGTGAGKSSALQAIRELGGSVIDCDAVYHQVLNGSEEFKNAINVRFPGVFTADGQLDRKKLGQEVFAKRDRLDQLNAIVSRFLLPELEAMVEAAEGLCALDAINLFESGLDRLCDRTVAVTAPTELRVKRIMARDHITEQYARLRLNAQKQDEYYRGKCDCELNNATESPEEFRRDAYLFFERLVEAVQEEAITAFDSAPRDLFERQPVRRQL